MALAASDATREAAAWRPTMPAKSRCRSLRSHLSPADYRGLSGRGCRAFVRVSTMLAGDGPHGSIILMHSASASLMRITQVTVSASLRFWLRTYTLAAPSDRLPRLGSLGGFLTRFGRHATDRGSAFRTSLLPTLRHRVARPRCTLFGCLRCGASPRQFRHRFRDELVRTRTRGREKSGRGDACDR
jgi:hypothetical protein